MLERVGSYWHLFPFHIQAKRAIWKGIDARTGQRFIDRAFPDQRMVNDTEMSFSVPNGSSWQMLGSDNYDRMVGSNPCGVVFSEWALCDPAAWDYIRPILVENKGWAMFITTFRGRNHAWRLFETVKQLEDWFTSLRTIDDTHRIDGSPDRYAERYRRRNCSRYGQRIGAAGVLLRPRRGKRWRYIRAPAYQTSCSLIAEMRPPLTEYCVLHGGVIKKASRRLCLRIDSYMPCIRFRNPTLQTQFKLSRGGILAALLIHHAIDPDPTLFSALRREWRCSGSANST
jgi:hypothetical protein